MNDRELLELAAKAAGVDGKWLGDGSLWIGPYDGGNQWTPLTDDGDALRLAVKLKLCLTSWPDQTPPHAMIGYSTGPTHGDNCIEVYGDDCMAATRRAIVRAAAEIGKNHVE